MSGNTLRAQILKVGLSGISGQAVSFLALPVLSRLYSPESFGIWALFMSVALLIGTVSTLRYELAVVLPKQDGLAAGVMLGAGAVALLFALASILVTPWLAAWLGEPSVSSVAWMLPLIIVGSAAFQLGLAWCTRRSSFFAYSLGQFALPAGTALVQCLSAMVGLADARGLIVGSLAGFAAGGAIVWFGILKFDRAVLARGLPLRRISAGMRRFYKYPLFMTPYSFLSLLRDRAIYFLLGSQVGGGAVGYYSLAQRFTNIPNSVVAGAVRPVFFQHAARRPREEVALLATTIMTILIVLTVPNVVVFSLYAEPILSFLFGSEWAGAAPYAVLLAIPAVPLLLGNWMDRMLDVSNRQGLAFGLELAFSLATILSLVVGFAVFGDVYVAVALQAAAMSIYFCIWIVIVFGVAGFSLAALWRLAVLVGILALLTIGWLALGEQLWRPLVACATFYGIYVAGLAAAFIRYRCAIMTVMS